tara:strand:+ start:2868 stop:3446 length:579 start_codon:yes stop_codon:yes gene_type:complete
MGKKELTKKQLKKSLKNITEGSIQMKNHLKTAYNAMKSLDKVSTGQKIKNEKGDNVTVTPSDNKKILAAMRKVEDLYRDIIGGEIKDKEDSEEKKKSEITSGKNEQSEGYGSMPSEVVKMTEATLRRVVERVIEEQTFDFSWEGIKNIPGFWVDKTKEVKKYLDGEKTPETSEEAKEAASKLIKKLQSMFGL